MKNCIADKLRASVWGALLIVITAWTVFGGITKPGAVQAATSSGCPTGQKCFYVPLVMGPVPGDLSLDGVEFTQAIQDAENGVPLVAQRKTMLRIYARAQETSQPMSNVKVALSASTNSGASMSGSPQSFTATVPLTNDRGTLSSTINLMLPSTWLNGTVNITIRLDPNNQIAELDESNNAITTRLVFHSVPPLRIKVVPIAYTHKPNGHTYLPKKVDTISSWIMRTYPINQVELSWDEVYPFSGDLKNTEDWNTLLNNITTRKQTAGAPASQIYYGLIPTSDSSGGWFSGGVAGLGWVGMRTAIGLDYSTMSGEIAAHEMGHNLGMSHTPCGGPLNPDPNFPYSNGIIGQYGVNIGADIATSVLYAPSQKDVMSYCSPKWVSDYTYEKLYTSQVQNGASQSAGLALANAAQRGLLVRAQILNGGASLLPAYVLPGAVTEMPEPGDYEVQVFGASGEMIAKVPVRAYVAEATDDTHIEGINTLVPLPDAPAVKFQLVKNGTVLAEQALSAGSQSETVTQNKEGNAARLSWDAGQQSPSLLRYTLDNGATWTTLGVDLTEGDLLTYGSIAPGARFEVIPAGTWK